MANPLQAAGALAEQSTFAPLRTESIFTGLFTNRSVFRDGTTQALMSQFYGSRFDSIIDGLNTEISTRLTLRRRPGLSVYNSQTYAPITRFYAWNTFTLTDEAIRVIADTASTVYDATGPATKQAVWTKSAGAGPTFFIGVGNNLYFTNGVDNKQMSYPGEVVQNWGIVAPTTAPSVSLSVYNPYGSWLPLTVFSRANRYAPVLIIDSNGNIQNNTGPGITGASDPPAGGWNATYLGGTVDGTTTWQNMGNGTWAASTTRSANDLIYQAATDGRTYFYQAQTSGSTGTHVPNFQPGLNSITQDGAVNWLNLGLTMYRSQMGGNGVTILATSIILDPNGGVQTCLQAGRTGGTAPSFNSVQNGFTTDPAGSHLSGQVIWQNTGAVSAVQYGFAFENSKTKDISNMSPASAVISTSDGQQVFVQQNGSADPQVDTIVVYRTLHGGSTFFQLDTFPFSGAGAWTYSDTKTDAQLNISLQAQRSGEGTPLPAGATCLEFHLGRIFAAVGNVVYVSSGPDAVTSGSSGMSGFDTTFTCQSKITRFWVNAVGLAVFTVRDAYMILGSATDSDPLYIQRWIDNLPLLHYDAFAVHLTTPYLFTGKRMVGALDPGAGIIESSFPIADVVAEFDPAAAYLTFHSESSAENALYIADGGSQWFRMAPTSPPEVGFTWSPRANIADGMSCVQSVEVTPGQYRLLIGPPAGGGPILMRDVNSTDDNGDLYPAYTTFGSNVLANPGQLAGLAWMTLEAVAQGTPPALSVLMGEISGEFEPVPRSRQDPPNLPPSTSLYSNRHSFLQNQRPIWCRHFQFRIDWPAEDAANELLAFTIFGQTWNEMRSQ